VNSELTIIDCFVLNSLLDDVESADSISGPYEGVPSRFTVQEIEESLKQLVASRLVERVEFDQKSKTWERFADYKKSHWFDLTKEGRAVALQSSAK
jgi:hypothetical protein